MVAAASVGRLGPSVASAKNTGFMHRGRHRYLIAALVALFVAVALPAAALAQSSGEDQYTDPLAGGGSGSTGGGSSGGGGGGGGSSTPSAPASTPPADTSPAQPQATPAQANRNSLPRTGFPIALLVGSGLIMVGTGLAVRRRTT
jgi:hypothetical protein